MRPSEEESQDDPITLSYYEQNRVLRYSDISNLTIDAFTIEDPGLIDITSEDPYPDIQQESITLSSGAVQPSKEDVKSALNKKVMDSEKQFKSKRRKNNSSDTNKKKNVDFRNNTGLSDLTIDAFTIEDPGLIDITSEDSDPDIQQESITLSSSAVQPSKEDVKSAFNKKVMDREKQFKSKRRKNNSSDTNKKKSVDFRNNTGLSDLTIDAFTIKDPGLIDITSEDPDSDIQQESITLSSGAVQPSKEDVKSALNKKVMDREKQFKSKRRKNNSSDTNKKKNVDFRNNASLIGMKISQKDVIVDDVPNINQNATNRNTKTKVSDPSSVKVVPERDVYERIIGKAYDNIKTYGNQQPTSTGNSLSNNSNADLRKASNLSANNTSKASIQTCPLEEVSFNKIIDSKRPKKVCRSKSTTTHEMSKPIVTQATKIEDAKITGQCGNVNVKPLIHNRKNVNINIYGHVSSEGFKINNPTDKKKICKSTDDQVINQVAPKVSISKNRSSAGQINKSTSSEKVTKVKRKNGVPNYNDNIALNVFDKMTKPATCDNARNMKIKNGDPNCNNQFKILKDPTITKIINNEKSSEQTKDKINANIPCHTEKPINMKRKVVNIIDDQVLTSFVPKRAASISNKRRNTVSSICPDNTTSLKVCSKSIFSDDKIIPHYHSRMCGNKTGNKDKNDKTDVDTKTIPVKLTQVKSPLEVNPEKSPETITERNENDYKPCKDDNNTVPLSQIKPSVPVIINKNNIAIEPTGPNINFSLNALPTGLPKLFPKFDPKINENVSNSLNKGIDIPDRLNREKNTEIFLRTTESAPYPNQRSYKNFSSTLPIQSIVSNRQFQEFKTNICLSPRTSHTAFPRSHRIRPWQAPYPSNYNQFNSIPNNQYPIFYRLMNAGKFAKNSYISSTVTPPPKFQHSPRPILPLYRPHAPCLPINISNTSPKDVHQVVNKDRKETSSSKIKNSSNEASAVENTLNGKEISSSVKNAKISETRTVHISPFKRSVTENINILNNTKEITHKEQKSKVKDCNEAKKLSENTYSPAILPILSFPEICDILLETSGYDYPNLKKTANNRTEWINKDALDQSDLDKKKRKMNVVITPDNKKGKISISEYKKRLALTTTSSND